MPKTKSKAKRDAIPVYRFAIGSTATKARCPTNTDVPCVSKVTSAIKRDKFDECAADKTCKVPAGRKGKFWDVRAQSGIRSKGKGQGLHIDTSKACTKTMAKGDKCRLQLGFDKGQAFLRACTAAKGKGLRVDVKDPQDAHQVAKKLCREWKENGQNWGFLQQRGVALGASRRRRRGRTLGMKDEQGFDLAEVRRIANLINYGVPIDEIRQKVQMTDTEFFHTYKAAERYLKQDRDR